MAKLLYVCCGDHRDIHKAIRRQRQMCKRDRIDIGGARHGGLLLRGFAIEGPRQFERFVVMRT